MLTELGTVETWYQYANGWMLDLVVSLNNISEIPKVLSLSFGWEEYDQCDSQYTGYVSVECVVTFCTNFD